MPPRRPNTIVAAIASKKASAISGATPKMLGSAPIDEFYNTKLHFLNSSINCSFEIPIEDAACSIVIIPFFIKS